MGAAYALSEITRRFGDANDLLHRIILSDNLILCNISILCRVPGPEGAFVSLQMKLAAAPFFRRNVGEGFGEVPAVAVKILRVVLALAIWVIFRLVQDNRAVLSRSLAVLLSIFNPNLDMLRIVGLHIAFRNRETAIAGLHLNAVIGDAQANCEAKRL